METSGIILFMPSAAPRLVLSVESVTQALKAASLAVEPKNVIRQSKMIVSETPRAAALVTMGNILPSTSVRISAKQNMEIPHRIYPAQIKILRLPTLSDKAPIKMVVTVAATALAETIREISAALAANIL